MHARLAPSFFNEFYPPVNLMVQLCIWRIGVDQVRQECFENLSRWFQVMGIPRWCGHCLTVIYSNIVPLNTKLFTKYLRRHPSKHIHTKNHLKIFQMPPRAIKHRLTCPIELTSGSFLIGRRGILVISRNRLDLTPLWIFVLECLVTFLN